MARASRAEAGTENPLVPQGVAARLRHRAGTHREVQLRIANLLPDPAVGAILLVAHDVTEQRAAEREAATTRHLLGEVLESLAEAVVVVDADGRIVTTNGAAATMFGYAPGELLGQPVEILLPEADRAVHRGHVQAFARGSVARRLMSERSELRARHKDGTEFPVEITISKTRLDDRQILTVVVRDLTERKRADDARRERERRFRALIQNSAEAMSIVGPDGTLRWASGATARVFGYGPGDPLPAAPVRLQDYTHPDDIGMLERRLAEVTARPGRAVAWESRCRMADGSYRWFAITATNLLDDPAVAGIVVNARDVTALREQAMRAACLSELSQLALVSAFPDPVVEAVVSALTALLPVDHAVYGRLDAGGVLTCRVAPADPGGGETFVVAASEGYWAEVLASGAPVAVGGPGGAELRRSVIPAAGGMRSGLGARIEVGGEPVGALGVFTRAERRWEPGERAFLAVCANVISAALDRWRAEVELEHQALHDPLTGLPNRVLLGDRVGQALVRRGRSDPSVALLMLDLDDFKTVNDSLGHAAGDALLTAVARRVASVLRRSDTLARIGGDEFVVLCEEPDGSGEGIVAVAQRVLEVLRQPFWIQGREVYTTVSIGIATADHPSVGSVAELLANADLAMYQAKRRGGDQLMAFDDDLRARIERRLDLARDLHRALDGGEFDVAYQPKIELATGRVVAAEALVRWRHPRLGVLHPDAFLRVAEEIGVIVALGASLMAQAFDQARRWRERFGDDAPERTWVNLSRRELLSPGLVDTVAEAIRDARVDGNCVGVEVTEHAFVDDLDAAATCS